MVQPGYPEREEKVFNSTAWGVVAKPSGANGNGRMETLLPPPTDERRL